MNLLNIFYYLCLSLSVSYMYSFSDIFKHIRNKISFIPYIKRPLSCPECASFWFGLLVSFLYNPIVLDYNFLIITNIFCGLITHLFASFLYKKIANQNNIEFLN